MKSVRSKMFMAVQYLQPKFFHWDSNKKYSDKIIIDNAQKYGSSKFKNKSSKYHYLYVCYKNYYFPIIQKYQHPFNDYQFIFKSDLKTKARLIQLHIYMRLNYFYFTDTLNNKKHSHKGKKGQTNIVPPKIASKLHDKDSKPALNRDKTVSRATIPPHIHFVIKFNKRKSSTQLGKWCGIAPQYFESGKGGRYAFQNAMAYLIHAKQPNKYMYDFRDVMSNKPVFDYQDYYVKYARQWKEKRAKDVTKVHDVSIDWLVQQVQHGSLTKQDVLANPQYRYVYADNMKRINDAVQFHSELEGELTLMALKHRRFSLSVFYIWGKPGSGKTFMALKLAREIAKKHKWQVYQSAPTNPLDDYSGEQIAMLDDVRSETMGASDWLKLLDPINISPNSARFHNKTISARVIIMTNPEPPAKFFGYMKNVHGNEPLSQFIRRLTEIAHVIDAQGHHKVLVSNVRKLEKPYSITIGKETDFSGQNQHAITRGTRYVSNPNQNVDVRLIPHDELMDENIAINNLSKIVDKRNNPKIKHAVKDKNMISLENFLNSWKNFKKTNRQMEYDADKEWVATGHDPKDMPF